MNGVVRKKFRLTGRVQGVGFRPFVYGLAAKHGLAGYVLNSAQGVVVEAEGGSDSVASFKNDLCSNYPAIAHVDTVAEEQLTPAGDKDFKIRFSDDSGERIVLPMADVSVCDDCLEDIKSPGNRRRGYPFTSCTYCGPRFTVTDDIPYDRERTTMSEFTLCPECAREYRDPADRRFHSQLNACGACGPSVSLTDVNGGIIASAAAAIRRAGELIRGGGIVAVKGLGGCHLACDASSESAVRLLRERKGRVEKPLAVMAPDIVSAKEICIVSEAEEKLLSGPRHPIVLLQKKTETPMSECIAPGCSVIGVMLPYTPLHRLLLAETGPFVVMTSGNMSDEPIVYDDMKAYEALKGIADCFLTNNRKIRTRCDDSVVRIRNGRELLIRRSRGYSPEPIRTGRAFTRRILACGAELKNTFCMTRGEYVFTSHHIGDLETLEALESFEEGIAHFRKMLHWEPDAAAYDMHPEYLSTKYALALGGIEKVAVQHHHAHIASCLADARERGPVIGVSMDGLGYGLDGTLWGGEFLVADSGGFRRAAFLKPVPLPGGAAAIKQPWRMAAVYLRDAFGDDFLKLKIPFVESFAREEWELLKHMIERGVNSPPTTSMGRLFDGISALVLLRNHAGYEGHAAVELESKATGRRWDGPPYEFSITTQPGVREFGILESVPAIGSESLVIDPAPIVKGVTNDIMKNTSASEISARFHFTIAAMIRGVCLRIGEMCGGLKDVALSGGVFQNIRLLDETVPLLENAGFRALIHERVPPNDGGLALGQAVVAEELLNRRRGV